MAIIKQNGDVLANNIRADNVQAFLDKNGGNDLTVEYTAEELHQQRRDGIHSAAGDTDSLLGTVSDGSGLLLVEVLRLATAMASGAKVVDMAAAAEPLAEMGRPLLEQIDSGEVQLPHMVKGTEKVLGDVVKRGDAVAKVLIAARDAD